MTLRDKRQEEFANDYIKSDGKGILYLCPRFGKIRTSLIVLNKVFPKDAHVLIAYPDLKIKDSWVNEFKELGYKNPNITYTTHLSLKNYVSCVFDIVILDEIHLLSDAQLTIATKIVKENESVLGLTGTMNEWTEKTLLRRLGLSVIASYPIEQAVEEGVVVDYSITVKVVPLDNKVKQTFGKKERTERAQFAAYSYIIAKLDEEGKDSFHLKLSRMRVIQGSIAKLKATQDLLKKFAQDRILVFCGTTDIADKIGCPSHHSKKEDSEDFDAFGEGKGHNHMAVCKIGGTGRTYKPLNKVIINYFDSNAENLAQKINRCMGMEYNNPDKKADIWIVCSNEEAELKWLKKALAFFDEKKVKYVS